MDSHITAQVASLPDRVKTLEDMVFSILPQVDHLFVGLNNYTEVPPFLLGNSKISYKLLDNSLGDAAKFLDVENLSGYVFTCDDDLVYPKDYVQYMKSKVDKYKGVVSLLGKVYPRPVTSFRRGYSELYRCLGTVTGDHVVDVVGTGAMAFHTTHLKAHTKDFKVPNMADIWLSKIAHEQGVPLIAVEHRAKYVSHKTYEWRIWTKDGHDSYQTELLNEFLK